MTARALGLVALGGALGALSRWGLATWVQRSAGGIFPWGTASVNLLGCFLFGFLSHLLFERLGLGPAWRLAILVGFMGSFTTFSSFGYETWSLARSGAVWAALGNVALQNVVGVAAVGLGWSLGTWLER